MAKSTMNRRKWTTMRIAVIHSISRNGVCFTSMTIERLMICKFCLFFCHTFAIFLFKIFRTNSLRDVKRADDEEGVEEQPQTPVQKKSTKKTADRWAHDFYDESEQAPKSRTELVNSYGYDIRNEDGPPKARRKRRYK